MISALRSGRAGQGTRRIQTHGSGQCHRSQAPRPAMASPLGLGQAKTRRTAKTLSIWAPALLHCKLTSGPHMLLLLPQLPSTTSSRKAPSDTPTSRLRACEDLHLAPPPGCLPWAQPHSTLDDFLADWQPKHKSAKTLFSSKPLTSGHQCPRGQIGGWRPSATGSTSTLSS